MILNMGCGELTFESKEKILNADIRQTAITDKIVDFDVLPYPFEAEQFSAVYAIDILEHLTNIIPVMEEIHRILKPHGLVKIRTTCWDEEQSYTDPTHKHFFTLNSFDFFDPGTFFGRKYHFYTDRKFHIRRKEKTDSELEFILEKIVVENLTPENPQ